ncbi:hypothetical protein BDR05DRAFT_967736 [Suillus weaverae]|nr:hypothetical protein BDR05DRAFT_967736 [Suillus weaverae]
MAYVAGRIVESFKTDLFVIWSEDSSEKLIIHCCVLGSGDKDDDGLKTVEEDIFLRQLENTMLNSVSLRGFLASKKSFCSSMTRSISTRQAPSRQRRSGCWRRTVLISRLSCASIASISLICIRTAVSRSSTCWASSPCCYYEGVA